MNNITCQLLIILLVFCGFFLVHEFMHPLEKNGGNVENFLIESLEGIFYLFTLAGIGVILLTALFRVMSQCCRTRCKMRKQLSAMAQTARSISAGTLHTRLDTSDCHDELKDFAQTFNEMLDRIQYAYEQQQRFVSDVSHELRNPITLIQGYANLLHRWGKSDQEVLEESIAAIKNEADNMQELVEKLLLLARSDEQTQKISMTPFALHELIDEILKETKFIDTEHDIRNEKNEAATICGDRVLIKQTVRICMDNSIKYTPVGGIITLNSTIRDGNAVVTVKDTGVGIPDEDLPYIFNRFYRCQPSFAGEKAGTGLGLSIAKWIIEKHRGSIGAENSPDGGTKLIIRLPLLIEF